MNSGLGVCFKWHGDWFCGSICFIVVFSHGGLRDALKRVWDLSLLCHMRLLPIYDAKKVN
jgi:hypothetical protein